MGDVRIMDNIVVSFEKFEHLYNLAKDGNLKQLRFELVMSALFPDILDNIKEEMSRQHTLGYIEGQKSIEQNFDTDN